MSRRDMPVEKVGLAWRSGAQTLKGRECVVCAAGRGARARRLFDGRTVHLQIGDAVGR